MGMEDGKSHQIIDTHQGIPKDIQSKMGRWNEKFAGWL